MGGWKTSCEMEEGQSLGGVSSDTDGFKLSVHLEGKVWRRILQENV